MSDVEIKREQGARNVSERERKVLEALRDLRYGSVEIVIHDGELVQIERKEKVRFSHQ